VKLLDYSRAGDGWRVEVELSSEEASLISSVFGLDVCSTGFFSVEELVGRLLYSILAGRRLQLPGSSCRASMYVSSVWLQSLSPGRGSPVASERLLEYLVNSLGATMKYSVLLADEVENLRGSIAPCLDARVSEVLQELAERLPAICIKSSQRGGEWQLEVLMGDSTTPRHVVRVVVKFNPLPVDVADKWYRGLSPRIGGCISVGEDATTIYVGDTRFRTGLYYASDCYILEAYMETCRERSLKIGREARLEEIRRAEDIIKRWSELGGEDIEVSLAQDWAYIRAREPRKPLESTELCLKL